MFWSNSDPAQLLIVNVLIEEIVPFSSAIPANRTEPSIDLNVIVTCPSGRFCKADISVISEHADKLIVVKPEQFPRLSGKQVTYGHPNAANEVKVEGTTGNSVN